MREISEKLVRFGLAATFTLIGVSILRSPEAWGGYMAPWVAQLLPVPVAQAMMGAGIGDIAIGILLVIAPLAWLGGLLGALHIAAVLVVSGVTDITVRDIGLLTASVAIFIEKLPQRIIKH